ncbi:MAG TPA: hypothetical protein ENH02_04015, partial [Bacteroidetes bacterium]|nr:hypothetical protein [Bacteroidota bacterium]
MRLENFETNCRLVGFTLQNGSGTIVLGSSNSTKTFGGGIRIYKASLNLEHCILKNNEAYNGGGISSSRSNLFLKGNRIFHNYANQYGGGILFTSLATPLNHIIFDQTDLNSLYMNYASAGYDLAKTDTAYCSLIILDTGTIQKPSHYYLLSISPNRYPVDNLSIQVNNWKIEQADSDLYVSPDGDDQNSGLSPDEPLKTIAFALIKIKSDSANPKTIHLAEGTYSPSQTGEKLAIGLKSYVALEGAAREKTVVDAENKSHCAYLLSRENGIFLKNISFIHGYGYHYFVTTAGIDASGSYRIILDSLAFLNCSSDYDAGITMGQNDTTLILNSLFQNNRGVTSINIYNSVFNKNHEIFFNISSCQILNNMYDSTLINNGFDKKLCIPISIYTDNYPNLGKINGTIINSEITNTLDSAVDNSLPVSNGVSATGNIQLNIINSTIGDNFT